MEILFIFTWIVVLGKDVLCVIVEDNDVKCGGEYRNVDNGEILPPSMSKMQGQTCTWILSAPPKQKLLININSINLPSESDSLWFFVDGEEYNIPRVCEKCWSSLVGEVLKIQFESSWSLDVADHLHEQNQSQNYSQPHFHVAYRSFDPNNCVIPTSPKNGYHVGKSRQLGSIVRYGCVSPYESVGNNKATCVSTEDSVVPIWNKAPPSCVIPDCNGLMLNRTAGKGVIVHPGYPADLNMSEKLCKWVIRADEAKKIAVNVKSLNLPGGNKKSKNEGSSLNLYDGDDTNLLAILKGQESSRVIVTESNILIIQLKVHNSSENENDAGPNFGFYIEYSSTCKPLAAPANGVVMVKSLLVGSNASFYCDNGYTLEGESVVHCLPSFRWSKETPSCVANLLKSDYNETAYVSTTIRDFVSEGTSTVIVDFDSRGIVKGSRKHDLPSHQNTNGKHFDAKPDKMEEEGKHTSISNGDAVDLHSTEGKGEGKKRSDLDEFNEFMIIVISAAVLVPIVMGCIAIGVCLWYRKQYPVRMALGRKFDTFENPMYEKRKRATNSPPVPSDPAELQRLTFLSSP